jgi:hypothetical protein
MATKQTAREQSEAATLQDVKAMVAAASQDADVKKKLGDAYLKKATTEIANAEALVAGKGALDHAKIAEGGHVLAMAGELLGTMQDIRDAVKLTGAPADVQRDFGFGADWKASSPTALVAGAHALEHAFSAHPKVTSEAHIDAQHRHDLTHLAHAIDDAHTHHRQLTQDRTDGTSARAHEFAVLRAIAHHVRLAARLAHRRDPAQLAHFASPVPHHQVVHRAAKGTAGDPHAGG